MTNPLFESTHNALTFAFNFSDQQYDRPLMNRLASNPVNHVSKGLSGMDGAAQAGMIVSRVMLMPALSQYIIFAQYAPIQLDCGCRRSCCIGKRPNPLWDEVIIEISQAAIGAMSGVVTHRVLRTAIVRKLFGDKSHRADVLQAADRCGLEERQAYNHQAAIKRWLDGTRGRKGSPGVRVIANEHIQRLLIDSGIVGWVEN